MGSGHRSQYKKPTPDSWQAPHVGVVAMVCSVDKWVLDSVTSPSSVVERESRVPAPKFEDGVKGMVSRRFRMPRACFCIDRVSESLTGGRVGTLPTGVGGRWPGSKDAQKLLGGEVPSGGAVAVGQEVFESNPMGSGVLFSMCGGQMVWRPWVNKGGPFNICWRQVVDDSTASLRARCCASISRMAAVCSRLVSSYLRRVSVSVCVRCSPSEIRLVRSCMLAAWAVMKAVSDNCCSCIRVE